MGTLQLSILNSKSAQGKRVGVSAKQLREKKRKPDAKRCLSKASAWSMPAFFFDRKLFLRIKRVSRKIFYNNASKKLLTVVCIKTFFLK